MNTPICDFLRDYSEGDNARFHMPGHKGKSFLGMEAWDLTEISGADDLHHPQGIIRESEENASALFGCPTVYSTEGASQCIRAMLFLATQGAGERPLILAGRNAHKVFLNAAILLDFDIQWLYPEEGGLLTCQLSPEAVEKAIVSASRKTRAVYLTSPDYLGNLSDVAGISRICRKSGVYLLVDNAHGAYLRFLPENLHPMALGADLCCDSGHKTFPVLTGGAYLHMREDFPGRERVKEAMALFGSTSPSYLILASLDRCNEELETMGEKLAAFLPRVEVLKEKLSQGGYTLLGREPLKITISAKAYGYTGEELGEILEHQGIFCEFCDPDYLVLMVTPQNTEEELQRLEEVLLFLHRKSAICGEIPTIGRPKVKMHPRKAALSTTCVLPVEKCLGKTLAAAAVSCPPAIPVVVCGEEIDEKAIALFQYYGITHCRVVRE